jgi:excisionase family DNA binding protein
MNAEPNDTLNIAITGVLSIGRRDLERLLAQFVPVSPVAITPSPRLPEGDGRPGRMCYSVKQTAELLGLSKNTVYRLLERGLLRSSSAVRTKVIPKSEIERFLKETTQSLY